MKKLTYILFISLFLPTIANADSVSSGGGMMFLSNVFKKACILNTNSDLLEKKIDNNNYLIVDSNFKFKKIINNGNCSVSTGTEEGIKNIAPFNALANKYASSNNLDVIRIPVSEIVKDNITNRYMLYLFSKKYKQENYGKLYDVWGINYTIYKENPIPKKESFIFSDTPSGYDNIKVTLTKFKVL